MLAAEAYAGLAKREQCSTSNEFDGREGLRVGALFVIMASSALGAFFPIMASNYSAVSLPDWCFFVAKFFGSGVIIATGFVHLLQPANEALTDPCLTGTFQDYPWAFGICLMSLYAIFLVEIVTHHMLSRVAPAYSATEARAHSGSDATSMDDELRLSELQDLGSKPQEMSKPGSDGDAVYQEAHRVLSASSSTVTEGFLSQVVTVFILEFGVIFHSVFIGLSLAVSGSEFITLFIVLIFHQMFEGLGLGTRIAEISWPANKRYTPWILALGFSISTPIAIAIGLGVRHSLSTNSRSGLIANGCFDAISSGILIYTGLVELMAHEFIFSSQFKGPGGLKKMLFAFTMMCAGSGLMALLGRWA